MRSEIQIRFKNKNMNHQIKKHYSTIEFIIYKPNYFLSCHSKRSEESQI